MYAHLVDVKKGWQRFISGIDQCGQKQYSRVSAHYWHVEISMSVDSLCIDVLAGLLRCLCSVGCQEQKPLVK